MASTGCLKSRTVKSVLSCHCYISLQLLMSHLVRNINNNYYLDVVFNKYKTPCIAIHNRNMCDAMHACDAFGMTRFSAYMRTYVLYCTVPTQYTVATANTKLSRDYRERERERERGDNINQKQ